MALNPKFLDKMDTRLIDVGLLDCIGHNFLDLKNGNYFAFINVPRKYLVSWSSSYDTIKNISSKDTFLNYSKLYTFFKFRITYIFCFFFIFLYFFIISQKRNDQRKVNVCLKTRSNWFSIHEKFKLFEIPN